MTLRKACFSLSLAGLLACAGWSYGQSDGLRGELAVVERERLWKCHGSYPQLEQVDWELGRLQTEQVGLLTRAQLRCDRLFQEQEAHRLWELEQSQMQVQAEQATRRFKADTEREMGQVQARFAAQIKATARAADPDWQLMYGAAVARFRLDKQKELSLRLQGRERQIGEEMARFEEDLARKFQDEKVSLQVKLQLAEDEQARRRLAAIEEELDARKAERRRQAEMEMRDYRTIEEGQLAVEVRQYEEGLRKEIQPPDLAPLRNQLAELQKLRQAQLVQVIRNLEVQARSHFQEQLARLPMDHQKAGEILPEAFLEPQERQRFHKLPELIAEVKGRRQKLYSHMRQGIARVVATQAQKNGLESVICDVRLNRELEDLTDVSLAGVSQLEP